MKRWSAGPFGGGGGRKARHGTNSGYAIHIKYGIPVCDKCRAAHNRYQRAYWQTRHNKPSTS